MLGVKKNPQILESLKGIAVNLVHLSKETIEELILVLPKLQEIQPQTNMSDERLKEMMRKLIASPSRLVQVRTILFIFLAADSVPVIKKFAL